MRYVLLLLLVVWWLRRHPGPCPWFLTALLENGYMEAVAGHRVLLSRLHLAPGMSVLDVGCGPGRLTLPVARAVGPSGRVVGLDVQPQMLARLSERRGGCPRWRRCARGRGPRGWRRRVSTGLSW